MLHEEQIAFIKTLSAANMTHSAVQFERDHPDDFCYLAMDADGKVFIYATCPYPAVQDWVTRGAANHAYLGQVPANFSGWDKTLVSMAEVMSFLSQAQRARQAVLHLPDFSRTYLPDCWL